MPRKILLIIIAVFASFSFFAQSGTLKGKVIDVETGEGIPFANVSIILNGDIVTGGMSDFDGNYTIKPISAGKYTIKATYMGYKSLQFNGLTVMANKITFQDFKLSPSTQVLQEVEVKEYTIPLISKDQTTSGGSVTSEDIAKMPGRSASSVAATVGGVYQDESTGDMNLRGARGDGTVYYVDGVKVIGSSSIPKGAQGQVDVMLGGIPAKYGDATGGIISITTKGPSHEIFGGVEILTSQFLDAYKYNLAEVTVSGPLIVKKYVDPYDTTKIKKDPVAGYFISTNITYMKEPDPVAGGYYKVNDATLQELIDQPIRPATFSSITKLNSEYLHEFDEDGNPVFENIKARENVDYYSMNTAAKIDFQPTKRINLTLGGTFDYRKYNTGDRRFQLFNYDNYGEVKYTSWRTYVRFTQKFTPLTPEEEEASKNNLIKNAFYQIQLDYSRTDQLVQDPRHKDDFFRYGYVGKFETYKIPTYGFTDTISGFPSGITAMNGFMDTLVTFEASDINPVWSSYTDYYYGLYDINSGYYTNLPIITFNGGLFNGQTPDLVYELWNSHGAPYNSYSVYDVNQFRISANGSADVKDHEISIGFEFEQRSTNYFAVAPVGLWNLARGYTNFHILELDTDNPHYTYDATGVPTDTVYYDRKYAGDVQYQFDEKFRESLGLDVDGLDWIDVDSYDPSALQLDFFSAEELLNSGNSYVSYYGYDHHGNKLKSKPSFEDFFNSTDENGRKLRPIAAFEPNYTAAYIQDKFAFYDLIFNVGVRIDRYDANQKVLKDPYSFYETYKAGDIRGTTDLGVIPSSIGDDYVVYVDDLNNPTSIKGYRSGDSPANVKWYDNLGTEVDNYEKISSATGINPYLVDPDGGLKSDAFKDYQPQITMMPRVSFSFPISDVALFFAHYDILSKRPGNNRLNPVNYLYIASVGQNAIENPNLKPERTFDYELGFQQKLSNSSSLKLSAFYREMRDMIQGQYIYGAYPFNYITFSNIDFGTVKGFTLTYDLRRTGNVTLRTSYTLQFANGTGSNAESGLSLIKSGQPNLRTTIPLDYDQRHALVASFDYRYLSGRLYDGPKWFGKDIFENTGANFIFNFGTGSPFSKRELSTGYLVGSLNGSRKPSRFTISVRLDRDIPLSFGKEESNKKKAYLNVYLDVANLLNTKNVINVYEKTGNPDDDGYLINPQNESLINSMNDPESYRYYYALYYNSPDNYSSPRTARLGIQLSF
ncbi:MAG: TonB-dependent receptor [Bacteroidota bacterium]